MKNQIRFRKKALLISSICLVLLTILLNLNVMSALTAASIAHRVYLPLIARAPIQPTSTPTATPSVTPPSQEPKGDGFYTVGSEISIGKWRSTGTGTTCYWARYDAYQNINNNHFGFAGGTVTIQSVDYEVELNDCGTWIYVENEVKVLQPDAASPKGDGFFTVGVEIVPGRWHSTGTGDECYWERLNDYQGIINNHFGLAGGTVTVLASDYEIQFNNCGIWEYLGE